VDYWALGVLIYELLAGHTPFSAETTNQLFKDIQHPELITYPSNFEPVCIELIARLLTVDPQRRLGAVHGIGEIKSHPWFSEDTNFSWRYIHDAWYSSQPGPLKRSLQTPLDNYQPVRDLDKVEPFDPNYPIPPEIQACFDCF